MNPFVVNPAKSTPVIHHNGTPGPHRLAPEILTGRVRHFRDRVIFGSRPLIPNGCPPTAKSSKAAWNGSVEPNFWVSRHSVDGMPCVI